MDFVLFGIIIDTVPNFYLAIPCPCLWPQGQGHRLKKIILRFLGAHIFQTIPWIKYVWYDLKAKVTDSEILYLIPYNVKFMTTNDWLIVLGFNDTSTLVGHFVSSPREREKRDRRDSRRDEREGQGRKRNRNESEETEEIKTSPPYPYLLQG